MTLSLPFSIPGLPLPIFPVKALAILLIILLIPSVSALPHAILFQFDDDSDSIYNLAYPNMTAAGMNATFYICTVQVDSGRPGYMNVTQLRNLYNSGWDLGSHTRDHPFLAIESFDTQKREIYEGMAELDGWGFTRASHHFAYPSNNYSADTWIAMEDLGVVTGRTTATKNISVPYTGDLYTIPGIYDIDSDVSLETAKGYVETAASNQTLIFLVHELGTPGWWTSDQYRDYVNYIKTTGVQVLTISQLYNNGEFGWLGGYSTRQGHYINGSDSAATDYTLRFRVSNTAGTSMGDLIYLDGKSLNFPNDIRFTSMRTNTELGYLIDSSNSTYADFFVRIPLVPKGSTNRTGLYIYYGNATVPGNSNGFAAFPYLFDHFDGTTLNKSVWVNSTSGTITLSDSLLTVSNSSIHTQSSFPVNRSLILNASYNLPVDGVNQFIGWMGDGQLVVFSPNLSTNRFVTKDAEELVSALGVTSMGSFAHWSLIRNGTASAIAEHEYSVMDEHLTQIGNATVPVYISADPDQSVYIDWVGVGTYVAPEPSNGEYLPEESEPGSIISFRADKNSDHAPGSVGFFGASTGAPPNVWQWDFGDGNVTDSGLQNPVHLYTMPGPYSVTLTVTNGLGLSATETKTDYIIIKEQDSPPLITVTSPNGGETWVEGNIPVITWTSVGITGSDVRIELIGDGEIIHTISPSTPDEGIYTIWTVPATIASGTDYRIRVTSASNPLYNDTSDNPFTIIAGPPPVSLTVTSPNGSETWSGGTTPTITWGSVGNPGSNVKIELLKGVLSVRNISVITANDGSFASWTVPATIASGTDYRIRITSTSNPLYTDTSDNPFTII
jgi:PKD repeat protein/peptidoglycan/xylan/chitin deacetylase (PgdA/CDA1 family)